MKSTQGRRIIAALKRKPMTSMELQMLGISTCWWKRVDESLRGTEKLFQFPQTINGKKINVYRVTGQP
jgi:hypothetical protein